MTKVQIENKMSKAHLVEKTIMGAALFTIVVLAGHELSRYIKASDIVTFILATLFMGMLVYAVLAPLMHND